MTNTANSSKAAKQWKPARFVTLALSALALTSTLHAQKVKVPVEVKCTSENDPTGARFCTALRDNIARSPRFEATMKDVRMVMHIITVSDDGPSSSAMSVTLTVVTHEGSELFLDSWVMSTGARRVQVQADNAMANLDQDVNLLQQVAAEPEHAAVQQ